VARDAAGGVGVEEQRASVKRARSAKGSNRGRLCRSSSFSCSFLWRPLPLTDIDALVSPAANPVTASSHNS
jgi:hypothetical protein